MMVMCSDVVMKHDGRGPGISNAPVVMEHGNNRTEISTAL